MATTYALEFEKPLQELERQIEDLQKMGEEQDPAPRGTNRVNRHVTSPVSRVGDPIAPDWAYCER